MSKRISFSIVYCNHNYLEEFDENELETFFGSFYFFGIRNLFLWELSSRGKVLNESLSL